MYRLVYCYECNGKHRLYCSGQDTRKRQVQKNTVHQRIRKESIISQLHAPLVPNGSRLCPVLPCPQCR